MEKYKSKQGVANRDPLAKAIFISEPGFYQLIFKSTLPLAEKFQDWVYSHVLASIRKYGSCQLYTNPFNDYFKIENETYLH